MHSNCILDSVANLLIRHMVFAGNVQKSPIASQLKGLDPSLDFCCHGPGPCESWTMDPGPCESWIVDK